MYQAPRFLPAGDCAFSVELGAGIDPRVNQAVHDLLVAIEERGLDGIMDLVPSYRAILVQYNPLVADLSRLQEEITALEALALEGEPSTPRSVEIPTLYGGEAGPDLDYVAQHNGLSAEEVVRIHSETRYLVYMLGFSPGFPYLGGMSERIETPRLATPRAVIPAGSVGIAERQTGVYPTETPGGWRLIGRTPLALFDPNREPPCLVEQGDYIQFVPINEQEYAALAIDAAAQATG